MSAITQVSSAPSRELYDKVNTLLDLESDRPAGLIAHAAAELPSGEVQIIDVWSSREELEAFAQSRLMPAFAQAGVMDLVTAGERPQSYEAFHLVRG